MTTEKRIDLLNDLYNDLFSYSNTINSNELEDRILELSSLIDYLRDNELAIDLYLKK